MPKKTVAVFGAGRMSKPCVELLVEDFNVIVLDREQKNLKTFDSIAQTLTIESLESLGQLPLPKPDVIVSLLPPKLHGKIARYALAVKANVVTASYISKEIAALGYEFQKQNLVFVGECGLDPGLDHMSLLSLLETIAEEGGEVSAIESWCGGLPLDPHLNPLGYLVSWSPEGVLKALKSKVVYRDFGTEVSKTALENFKQRKSVKDPKDPTGQLQFEAYANRNSLDYLKIYGLESIPGLQRFIRGTLRYQGWSDMAMAFLSLDFLDERSRQQETVLERFGNSAAWSNTLSKLHVFSSQRLEKTLKLLEWILPDQQVVLNDHQSRLQTLASLFELKLGGSATSLDRLVMIHSIDASFATGPRKLQSSLLVDGQPDRSAMSHVVGRTSGFVASLLLNQAVPERGIQRPTVPSIAKPTLQELKKQGLGFSGDL